MILIVSQKKINTEKEIIDWGHNKNNYKEIIKYY